METVPVEIIVDGVGEGGAHPGDGADGVGPRPQVRLGAQVFETVALLGDWVGLRILHPADHLHRLV